MNQILTSAAGAAIVGGVFGLITWMLNRYASVKDRKDDKDSKVLAEIEKLSKQINKVSGDVENLRGETQKWLEDIREEQGELRATGVRARILRFGDEVQHGSVHSEEHYRQILNDIDEYERYCESHKQFKNNTTVLTTQRIKDDYQKRLTNNDFLA